MIEVKAFNRWAGDGISAVDPGLQDYIATTPRIVPKTGARYAGKKFHKSKTFIVERFMNRIMVSGHRAKKHFMSSGHNGGKAQMIANIMIRVMERLEAATGKNPIQVLVTAIENAAPREEIIAIEYGGARYPKAVEVSPQRRIDLAMRFMTQGAAQKAFNKKKLIHEALAEEILNAFKLSPNSAAIARKHELERQADSSR